MPLTREGEENVEDILNKTCFYLRYLVKSCAIKITQEEKLGTNLALVEFMNSCLRQELIIRNMMGDLFPEDLDWRCNRVEETRQKLCDRLPQDASNLISKCESILQHGNIDWSFLEILRNNLSPGWLSQ